MSATARLDTLNWSDLGVHELPTGTVTLLLADIEGSTRLWETRPEEAAAAVARLDHTLRDLVGTHHGVRPIDQGEGDSFVVAFKRAGDAVACALALQLADLTPIRLRIGLHTGDIQLRDPDSGEASYIGPAINRTGRLRDLAHGGQTVLSSATEAMVLDNLPADAWLSELGTYQLRDLPRPERVLQLCHSDLDNEFPPLRTVKTVAKHNLPAQLTTFIGRAEQVSEVRDALSGGRLVTLTGAGGVGKTRLAVEAAASMAEGMDGGVWFVDLAPIADPDIVLIAVARALGLPDQPSRSTRETLLAFIGDRQMLVVLDNCEHLLDATASAIKALLGGCAGLRLLVTSREPIGVAGEATRRVPSLSLDDEAIELFVDRARLVRPDFVVGENGLAVSEICRRLDGMPLAIELAAARVRALSVEEIRDSLHDRFRLLTGTTRMAVRRQQTLRASVDWSHALLTQAEQVLFRRLAVFVGGFDLAAARAVAGGSDVERYQVLDQVTLLVDKSLVVAENANGATRYRLLETVRQYALEKLGESGEGEDVRARHRDHYLAIAGALDDPARASDGRYIALAEAEIDNLRAAFGWSLDRGDIETALRMASLLAPLWVVRGRIQEALMGWFDAALAESHSGEVSPSAVSRALADKAVLHTWAVGTDGGDWAEQAVGMAREIGDPALLLRALTARAVMAASQGEAKQDYFDETFNLARSLGDKWTLGQVLGWQASFAFLAGDPTNVRQVAGEGYRMATESGDRFTLRYCGIWLAWAQLVNGDVVGAASRLREIEIDAQATQDALSWVLATIFGGLALSYRGDIPAARLVLSAPMGVITDLGGLWLGNAHGVHAQAALAAGAVGDLASASTAAWEELQVNRFHQQMYLYLRAEAAMAQNDLDRARRQADAAVAESVGWHRLLSLATRARVAIAEGKSEAAERDVHDALASAVSLEGVLAVPQLFELLATLNVDADRHAEAARLLGAAQALRQRMGAVRFKSYDGDHDRAITALREALSDNDFDVVWAEGAALSTEEAIAYAQRGRGQRKRPSSGWGSLTPAERAVVDLVSNGLANKAIAAKLFISLRTVESHLTHIYTKLALSSRVQLVQEAARQA
ncbi:LuxR C-terminal-related transcriptional regulator [Mycobacterium asiaticum]|uniref:LuxR C-terminal-related transcriptional regulator n=1 Tax=Mycobacterium asiaticum TaxID=1790 RepID=UPI0020A4832B|nr:LuxR C-terminal-related transcriptional regulator [Mycobacterium asiaticum]